MLKLQTLEQLLSKTFDDLQSGLRKEVGREEYERRKHDFVFHMTDWKDDLEQYAALVQCPQLHDQEAATALVVGFLYHAVNHLRAAAQLLLDDIGDPFGVDKKKRKPPRRLSAAKLRSGRRVRNAG